MTDAVRAYREETDVAKRRHSEAPVDSSARGGGEATEDIVICASEQKVQHPSTSVAPSVPDAVQELTTQMEWWRKRAQAYHAHFRRCLTELDGGKFRSTDEYMRTCPAWVGCGGECGECPYTWQTPLAVDHD